MIKYAVVTLLLFIFIAGVDPALADPPTATPTPTLLPIHPTATSVYLYLRPTPTPLTIELSDYHMDLSTDAGGLADLAINVYRAINRDHLVDFAMFLMAVIVVVLYLVRLISRYTKIK